MAAAGVGVAALLAKGFSDALDIGAGNDKLAAQLGLSEKQSARVGRVAGRLYGQAYGDSLGTVNEAIRRVMSNIGGMANATPGRLKKVSAAVLDVATAFDTDLGMTTAAVGQLMRTGLAKDATDALDIITKGLQSPADKAGDLLETFNEYSTQFRQLGLDGATATGLLSQGLRAGARDADIVADALKAFAIRAQDGSAATAKGFRDIGLSAGDMSAAIAKGGPGAAAALDATLDRLRKVKDPARQAQIAVALFGTQSEDLQDALYKLDPSRAVDRLGKVEGAAKRMGDTLNDNAATKVESFKRRALQNLTDTLAKHVIPAFERTWPTVKDTLDRISQALRGTGPAAKAVVGWFQGIADWWADDGQQIADYARTIWGDLQQIFRGGVTFLTGLWDTLAGVLTLDWRRAWGGVQGIVTGAWQVIHGVVDKALHLLGGIFRPAGERLAGLWRNIWGGITRAVGGAWDAITRSVSRGVGWVRDRLSDGARLWQGTLGAASQRLRSIVGDAWDAITGRVGDAVRWVWDRLKLGASWWKAVIQLAWKAIVDRVRAGWDSISGRVRAGIDWVRTRMTAGMNVIKDLWGDRWDTIRERVGDAFDRVKATVTTAMRSVRERVSGGVDRVKQAFGGLRDAMGNIWARIAGAIRGGANTAIGLLNKFIDAANAILDRLGVDTKIPTIPTIAAPGGGTGTPAPRRGGRNMGGWIPGAGPDRDTVLTPTTPGEYVVRRREALRHRRLLEAINAGRTTGLADTELLGRPRNAGGLVALGRQIEDMGYDVWQHPAFPPVWIRPYNSLHNVGKAIDVNYYPASQEPGKLDTLHAQLRPLGLSELFWRVADHYDHLHIGDHNPDTVGLIGNGAGAGAGRGAGMFDWVGRMVDRLVGSARDKVMGPIRSIGGLTGQIAGGVGRNVVDAAVGWVTEQAFSFAPSPGGGVARWAPVVARALGIMGEPAAYKGLTLRRMDQESGGDPGIVNRWDSNWARGTPSVGLMQVIGPTYASNKHPGYDVGPYKYGTSVNPMANILASMRYALATYGSLPSAYNRAGGYDQGGWLRPGRELVVNGLNGKREAVMPEDVMRAEIRAGIREAVEQTGPFGPAAAGGDTWHIHGLTEAHIVSAIEQHKRLDAVRRRSRVGVGGSR